MSSPTTTPPVSSAWFQVRPKSLRLILPFALKPSALAAPGILAAAFRRHVERDFARGAADRQIARHRQIVAGRLRDARAAERQRREVLGVEEVGRTQVRVALRLARVDAGDVDRRLDLRRASGSASSATTLPLTSPNRPLTVEIIR